jgi:hypothetical protein
MPNFPLDKYFFHVPGKKSRQSGRASGGLITLIDKKSCRNEPTVEFSHPNLLAVRCHFYECQIPIIIVNVYRGSSTSPIFDEDFVNKLFDNIE